MTSATSTAPSGEQDAVEDLQTAGLRFVLVVLGARQDAIMRREPARDAISWSGPADPGWRVIVR